MQRFSQPPPKSEVERLAFPSIDDMPMGARASLFDVWRGMTNDEQWLVVLEHGKTVEREAATYIALDAKQAEWSARFNAATFLVGVASGVASAIAVVWILRWERRRKARQAGVPT